MAEITGKDQSGKGGINQLAISSDGRAAVESVAQSHQEESMEDGHGWTLYSTYSATGAQEVWFLQNDGEDIAIDRLTISTSASGIFTIMRQTSGTATGTTMIGRNGRTGGAIMADITALGNAEVAGSVDGEAIDGHDIGTSAPYVFNMSGLVIPRTEALFVRAEVTGVIHVVGYVHREEV